MIYAPSRFLFIHIPRTAGIAITTALAKACVGKADCIIATNSPSVSIFHRHATAAELRNYLPDWDSLYKFAVYRPAADIAASEARLHARDRELKVHEHPMCDELYRKWLLNPWQDYFSNVPVWDKWCKIDGKDVGIHKIEYADLRILWSSICENCCIPFTRLPKKNSKCIKTL